MPGSAAHGAGGREGSLGNGGRGDEYVLLGGGFGARCGCGAWEGPHIALPRVVPGFSKHQGNGDPCSHIPSDGHSWGQWGTAQLEEPVPGESITVPVPAQVRQEQTDPEGHSQLPVCGLHEPDCRILYHRLQAAGTQDLQGWGLCPTGFALLGPEPGVGGMGWGTSRCWLAASAPGGKAPA